MKTIKEIIDTFPEPFRTATKLERINFDYKLNPAKNDHEYLKRLGYEPFMGRDCSYYIKELINLNPTSYGDWGSVYKNSEEDIIDGVNKSFYMFCKMYEDGIVKLWRISLYMNGINYTYDDEDGYWLKYEDNDWRKCNNPLSTNIETMNLLAIEL